MMKTVQSIIVSICLMVLLMPGAGRAGTERILSFDSQIDVFEDGGMVVTETIRVVAAGRNIKRGIYRDFPTRYRTDRGGQVTVRFDVLEVQRDGRPEAYHTESLSNGTRVYMGRKDVFLEPGEYTYTLAYRTDRQIGFFDEYDELYWNVTGNGWDFAIAAASAVVRLPRGAEVVQQTAYTGPAGATGRDYTASAVQDGYQFKTTRPLAPHEGLTIAVAWPKGIVQAPGTSDKLGYLVDDHREAVAGLAGLIVLLIYYLVAWGRVGRDPVGGAIIPRYAPPGDISPAAMRFVHKMGFDRKALAVAVVSMAVKGYLSITEEKKGEYRLAATGEGEARLSPGEARVAHKLFPAGQETITLAKSEHQRVSGAVNALRTSLRGEYEKGYFLRNTAYFVPGLVISLIALGGIFFSSKMAPVAIFMMVWLSGWSAGVYLLGTQVVTAWRSRRVAGAMGSTLFAIPFFVGEVVGIGFLASIIAISGLILFLCILAANIVFYHLLKAPTLAGRQLMDEIEGLRLYMQVAEKDRMNLLNPPDRTPEHFEALLPYAMALDVENEWNDQFADVLARAAVDPSTGRQRSPAWYNGPTPLNGLAGTLGSGFAGAVSSSSSAPGSSSGSGGGGSSGGGGGGGGGGGW
jgi:uncharacterized membrane protein YgcG